MDVEFWKQLAVELIAEAVLLVIGLTIASLRIKRWWVDLISGRTGNLPAARLSVKPVRSVCASEKLEETAELVLDAEESIPGVLSRRDTRK